MRRQVRYLWLGAGALALVLVAYAIVSQAAPSPATPTPGPTPSPVATQSQPAPTATSAPAPAATNTPAPTQPIASAPTATASATALPPTATATVLPPTATATAAPPTATATAAPPTATATSTALPPTATATNAPATATATVIIPTSSASVTINGQTLSYKYPGGWMMNQTTKDGYSVVSLEGPKGALLTISMYGMDMQPAQLSSSLLDEMKRQFSGVTATATTGTVGGFAAEGYTIKFSQSGVPITGVILSFKGAKASFTVYTQAADADLSSVQPSFDVIKTSLVVK